MVNIDLNLKKLLSGATPAFNKQIGLPEKFTSIPVEIFEETELRVDILCRKEAGYNELFHAELQNDNISRMLLRMMRYKAGIANRIVAQKNYRITYENPFPNIYQVCVYVGNEKMHIQNRYANDGNVFHYRLIDARELNGTKQLASHSINDVVLAIICSNGHTPAGIGSILDRVATLALPERSEAFARLIVLAELRGVGHLVKKRKNEMGFSVNISNSDLFQEELKKIEAASMKKGRISMVVEAFNEAFEPDEIPSDLSDTLESFTDHQLVSAMKKAFSGDTVAESLTLSASHGM